MLVARNITVQNHSYAVAVPDACPVCHRHSEVQFFTADNVEENNSVQAVFRCAYQRCRSFFICSYGPLGSSQLLSVRPVKPKIADLPKTVLELSPTFVLIFRECEEATQLGLKQVAGPGYRKAFEFLVKDYAKSLSPNKSGEIEKMFSGAVVNEFVPDARIQAVAKRCLWLGNDETHYLRKWTDHDVSDLVTLIRLTASWIEIEHLSKSYLQEMPE